MHYEFYAQLGAKTFYRRRGMSAPQHAHNSLFCKKRWEYETKNYVFFPQKFLNLREHLENVAIHILFADVDLVPNSEK